MGQRLIPHSGYRQRQAKIFNYVKTQGKIELSLGEILQILSIVLFEKVPISQVLTKNMSQNEILEFHNQLLLFNL